MWRPQLDFITIHYLYITFLGILGLILLYPYGNLSSTDAYFFGVSGSTESGLNVVDVNKLALYQQLVLYFIPILGNMQVVSIFVLIIRLLWFRKVLKAKVDRIPMQHPPQMDDGDQHEHTQTAIDTPLSTAEKSINTSDPQLSREALTTAHHEKSRFDSARSGMDSEHGLGSNQSHEHIKTNHLDANTTADHTRNVQRADTGGNAVLERPPMRQHITFTEPERRNTAPPDTLFSSDEDEYNGYEKRGRTHDLPSLSKTRSNEAYEASVRLRQKRRVPSPDHISIHRVLSNAFVLGGPNSSSVYGRPLTQTPSQESRNRSRSRSRSRIAKPKPSTAERLKLSANAMMGRNSNFSNLSDEDKELLGGIEYRSLKLLLKVALGYYFSLHIIGLVCLVPWIFLTRENKYRQYLSDCGLNKVWWAIYSSGTMSNNLGFTLTPDSMISFRDSVFPILIMTFLAYAGHTFYPVGLRFLIWTLSKCYPRNHKIQEPLAFLLDHPRRCYTLLFPSRPTWILAGILVLLNFVDVLLILTLDLDNNEVTSIPIAPRFISSIFQAASSRHTGTSTFNLANVDPGVQFSLLVMMYVAVFPIALSVRSSNAYEEASLGIYDDDVVEPTPEQDSKTYLLTHARNQLSFDLWWIFLGCFIICCIESDRIMDQNDPAFQVFPIFFEVASAYGNVGLSLGYTGVSTSFSYAFRTASKLVICAMMIRGRHRGLPVKLDRAIMLPEDQNTADDEETKVGLLGEKQIGRLPKLKHYHTQ